jgi:tetratricopeptide (TPR) repeat protein
MLLLLNPLGRLEEGIAQMEAAIDEDPLNAFLRIHLAAAHYWAGQNEQSIRHITEAMELSENLWVCHFGMGCVQFKTGKHAQALVSFERARESAPWCAQILGHLAALHRLLGSVECSNQVMLELRRLPAYTIPLGMAVFHSMCSEHDVGAEFLSQAIELHDPWALVYLFNPVTEVIRRSSSWPSVLQRVNLSTG